MPKTLLSETIRLLRERPRPLTLEKLSLELGISVSWLSSLLSTNPPANPSVVMIEQLYLHLSDVPLFAETKDDFNTPSAG